MSFSGDIKEELCREQASDGAARKAELFAVLYFLGAFPAETGQEAVVKTESVQLAKRIILLLKEICSLRAELTIKKTDRRYKSRQYRIRIPEEAVMPLRTAMQEAVDVWMRTEKACMPQPEECRAWLRGAFLAVGSMSDPEKSYHLEWICRQEAEAAGIAKLADVFSVGARVTSRKNRFVVYLKDSSDIVDMLNIMGAHHSLLQMENIRILKEVRNSVNRQSNCDTANIKKIVRAAGRQTDDIRYIAQTMGLEKLPPALFQMASLRLEYPDVSLQELGELLDPPVGKSGVNHRLRKLSQIAADLREKNL